MHGVDADALAAPAPGKQRCECHLHALGAGVCDGPAVATGTVFGIPDRQRLGVHAARRHQDHSRVVGLGQHRNQQFGQQYRPEDVGGQRDLMALVGLGAGRGQQPGIVDQHVQPGHPGAQVCREGPNGTEAGDIADLHPHVGAGGRGDLVACALPTVAIAHGQHNGGSQLGQPGGNGLTQAAICAGDHRGAAPQGCR
ncbi:hypothetical protein MMEU_5287 [Mycobacterium marinum str. Europe]|nr:hypothetical protein MMEU_5287 [Mycobacterium marinum str. Europe]